MAPRVKLNLLSMCVSKMRFSSLVKAERFTLITTGRGSLLLISHATRGRGWGRCQPPNLGTPWCWFWGGDLTQPGVWEGGRRRPQIGGDGPGPLPQGP